MCQKELFRNVRLTNYCQAIRFAKSLLAHIKNGDPRRELQLLVRHICLDTENESIEDHMDLSYLHCRVASVLPLLQCLESFTYTIHCWDIWLVHNMVGHYISQTAPLSLATICFVVSYFPSCWWYHFLVHIFPDSQHWNKPISQGSFWLDPMVLKFSHCAYNPLHLQSLPLDIFSCTYPAGITHWSPPSAAEGWILDQCCCHMPYRWDRKILPAVSHEWRSFSFLDCHTRCMAYAHN